MGIVIRASVETTSFCRGFKWLDPDQRSYGETKLKGKIVASDIKDLAVGRICHIEIHFNLPDAYYPDDFNKTIGDLFYSDQNSENSNICDCQVHLPIEDYQIFATLKNEILEMRPTFQTLNGSEPHKTMIDAEKGTNLLYIERCFFEVNQRGRD